jgi:ABC-type transporter Mla subunit MlaD
MQPYLQYIVLLGAVVIAYAIIMPRKKQHAALPAQTVQNMETALEQFMENMEKDNQELVQLVAKAQQETKSDADRNEQRIIALERKCDRLTEQLELALSSSASPVAQPVQNIQAVEMEAVKLSNEAKQLNKIQVRYSELFQLYGQGKSIEVISKKLGMNKGEVQLIIQLAKQEEAAHA